MRPVSAEFVTSVAAGGEVPAGGLPVIALVGRSNVGKSSLINALVKSRIARSGAKPGTTRLLNVYRVSVPPSGIPPFVLVDLPGYGYARGGMQARRDFDALTSSFFSRLTTDATRDDRSDIHLAGVILVVDIRHPGLDSDMAALSWALESGFPLVAVTTKADRISRAARKRAVQAHSKALARPPEPQIPLVAVSTRTAEGIGNAWRALKGLL